MRPAAQGRYLPDRGAQAGAEADELLRPRRAILLQTSALTTQERALLQDWLGRIAGCC